MRDTNGDFLIRPSAGWTKIQQAFTKVGEPISEWTAKKLAKALKNPETRFEEGPHQDKVISGD